MLEMNSLCSGRTKKNRDLLKSAFYNAALKENLYISYFVDNDHDTHTHTHTNTLLLWLEFK